MTTLKKLTEKEYEALNALELAIVALNSAGSNIEEYLEKKDVKLNELDGLLYDLANDELAEAITRYKDGETTEAARDSDGVGFTVVEVLHGFYDNIFGYTIEDGEKVFYLAETSDSYNEELERDEVHFFIDDEPVTLNDCIRVDIGG